MTNDRGERAGNREQIPFIPCSLLPVPSPLPAMKRKPSNPKRSKVDMTPMIDVVFLLLSFFIMTFKIIAPEGDFNIRMPPKGTQSDSLPSEPIRIKLYATPGGGL